MRRVDYHSDETASLLNSRGAARRMMNILDAAQKDFEDAWEILEKIGKTVSPSAVALQNSISAIHQQRGSLDLGMQALSKSVSILTGLGQLHSENGMSTYENMANSNGA